jgi:hypothetical protein
MYNGHLMDTVSGDGHVRLNPFTAFEWFLVVRFLAEVSGPDCSYCHYYSKPSLIRTKI